MKRNVLTAGLRPSTTYAPRCGFAAWVLLAMAPSWSDELPAETRAQMIREQAVEAVKRADSAALFDAMDDYRALEDAGVTAPPGLFFAEADAARTNGDPVRAERAFGDYFRVATPEGWTFNEAMKTYSEFRASIPESTWSVLETMVPVPGGILPANEGHGEVRIAPFSISQQAVTQGQFDVFVDATGRERPAQGATDGCPGKLGDEAQAAATQGGNGPASCVSWVDANAYVDWLSNSSGVRFRLPSATEWTYAMGILNAPKSLTGWVADCAGAVDGAENGASPSRPQPCTASNLTFRLALGR